MLDKVTQCAGHVSIGTNLATNVKHLLHIDVWQKATATIHLNVDSNVAIPQHSFIDLEHGTNF